MLAQKYRPRIPELWPKFTFLLKQQIKFILISVTLRATPLTIFEGWGGGGGGGNSLYTTYRDVPHILGIKFGTKF